ncbi:ATP-binding protein [Kitasatospora sp. NPDC048540]|uniref:ATP-binding protein n=1 Tax=Kitasatospora sp. NPDC048540 TaxID=3155634 RepID=UPI0033F678C1
MLAHLLDPPVEAPPGFRFDIRPAATPAGVGAVRRLLRDALTAAGADPDTPCLLLSELLTNAVLHGAAASVVMELRDGRVLIVVADHSPAPVERLPESTVRTGGRGLALVEALADVWGVAPFGACGKAVWASVTAA